MLDAMERFGAFQRAHQDEFSRVFLPDDPNPVLRRRKTATLLGERGDRAIALGHDVAAVVTYSYDTGFKGFIEWSLPLLQDALKTVAPTKIGRVRYVYENEIHLPQSDDEDSVDLGSLLNIVLPHGGETPTTVRHVHLGWTQSWPRGVVNIRIDSCRDSMDPDRLDLKIGATCKGPVLLEDLHEWVSEAHRIGRLTFESLITDQYREQLRKGVCDA